MGPGKMKRKAGAQATLTAPQNEDKESAVQGRGWEETGEEWLVMRGRQT